MDYAIGIDLGTTNSKVVLCELPSGRVVYLEKFTSPKIVDGDSIDFDIKQMIPCLKQALKACSMHAGNESIEFISIASVGESGVLVYDDGSYLERAIAWFDKRGGSYADALHAEGLAERFYGVTGIPAFGNYGLFKLLWMRDHGVDLKHATWLPLGDFVAWWLSGVKGQDESLASRTFALDVKSGKTANEILERYGMSAGLFPGLVESGIPRGMVRPVLADKLGLPRSCEVCVSGHDHMSGSVACGLDPAREALNSTGTSEGILTVNEAPVLTQESFASRLSNGRYVRRDSYSYYASLPTAGFSLAWLSGMLDIDEDIFFDEMPGKLHRRYLEGEFDGREMVFIPHLRGSGPPDRRVDARGCLYGFTGVTTRDDLYYATVLGLVFELKRLYDCMLGAQVRETVKVIGPAIKSPLWMQLKSDVLDVRIEACRVRESVARGAVMLTAQKKGLDAKPQIETISYSPCPERTKYLGKLYETTYLPMARTVAAYECKTR